MLAQRAAPPRRQVLLVEDDHDLGATIADALQDAGFDVLRASNGKVALEKLRDGADPDVILLDLMMPEMNGWQFRSAQKLEPRWGSTPVIVMSANDSAHARAIDADIHIWKPFPLSSLVGAVENAIAIRDRRREATSRAHEDRLSSVSTLAAGLAHEINNPLTGLLGNLQLAERLIMGNGEIDREAVTRHLKNAQEAGAMIARIVKDTATLAEGEARLVPVDPRQILASAIGMLSTEIGRTARIESDHGSVPLVLGARGELLQAFLNVLMNALQSLPDDRPGIVTTRTFTSEEGEAVIEISDNGKGIADEQLATVFEPFFTTKPPGEGSGLGLSISHALVSRMGGRIAVQSKRDVGSTFRIHLPPGQSKISGLHRVGSTARGSDSSRMRILVVEGDEIVAKCLRMLLEPNVVIVESELRGARERVLAGEAFDLVICDQNLRDGTGADLHIAITQYRTDLADRFILMMGGGERRADAEFIKRLGSRTIAKPFARGALEAAIREVTDSAGFAGK